MFMRAPVHIRKAASCVPVEIGEAEIEREDKCKEEGAGEREGCKGYRGICSKNLVYFVISC